MALNETDLERRLNEGSLRKMTAPPEECARQIINGIVRGRKRLLIGSGSRTLYLISRLFPDNYGWVLNRLLRI